jgi:Terminase-like family.
MAKITKKEIQTHALSHREFEELVKASKDLFYFSKFIKVIHPVLGMVSFILYPYQISVLYQFLKHKFNVILKFRQAGVTELIAMYCLWFAMYHPHKNIVIISIKDRVAKKVLRKIKFMYENLPIHLKVPVVNGRGNEIGTSYEMEFPNGSTIASIPTTEDAGRSEAVSLLIIDEAAIVRWADRIWAGLWPTLSTGGRAIVNSTAYGVGNFFHKLYTNAITGGNKFNPIRLYWQMHPERDQQWYNDQLEILGPRKTAQEIDGDFLTSGNTVFDLADIRDIEDSITDYPVLETRENGLLKVFGRPEKGKQYFLGADIATGRSQDYTAFSIMDRAGDEVVCYKGRIPIDRAEKLMVEFAKKYNRAVMAPESNDIGLGLATNLQTHGYPNLYYSRSLLRKKGKSKPEVQEIPGWYTTKKNRPIIIANLEEDIRHDTIDIKDKFFCDECPTFIYDSRNRPVAMNKDKNATDELFADEDVYTDDSIFAHAITNHVRKQRFNTKSVLPK